MRIVLPCNMDRLIWNAKKVFRINARKTTDLSPLRVVEGVRYMSLYCNSLVKELGLRSDFYVYIGFQVAV